MGMFQNGRTENPEDGFKHENRSKTEIKIGTTG
jgi:hypothetical protein